MLHTNGTGREHAYAVARQAMVREQLQARGITDTRILRAMGEMPRHLFVAPEWRQDAYSDQPLPLDQRQTISQPYMVAYMLQCLALRPTAKVLDVGTGSGYQAALLSRLASQVYSMECFPALAEQARAVLGGLGITTVQILIGDGSLGLPQYAPYDGIIVAAAAPHTPPPLLTQLAAGGRLVIPVGNTANQQLLVITRQGTSYHEARGVRCRFVPLLGEEGWSEAC